MDFFHGLQISADIPTIGKASAKIRPFVELIQRLRQIAETGELSRLLETIIEETGYVQELKAEGTEEAESRIQNIDELLSKVVAYEEEAEVPSLSEFLEEVALVADIDSLDDNTDYVVLMTLHSAKGLEFPNVYLSLIHI